jgi:hypothetical protein
MNINKAPGATFCILGDKTEHLLVLPRLVAVKFDTVRHPALYTYARTDATFYMDGGVSLETQFTQQDEVEAFKGDLSEAIENCYAGRYVGDDDAVMSISPQSLEELQNEIANMDVTGVTNLNINASNIVTEHDNDVSGLFSDDDDVTIEEDGDEGDELYEGEYVSPYDDGDEDD